MTQTLATGVNNDLVRHRDGNVSVLTGVAAVADLCKTAVQAQLGEMMYAADKGMPTFATAWNDYNPVQFEAAARVIIQNVVDVLGVESFTVSRQGEALRYTAVIRTVYGEAVVNG